MRSIRESVLPGTPEPVVARYETIAERAPVREFGLIEDDVVVLDTETTGLSSQENELIEIAAARLRGREITERFQTFVHPKKGLIPEEIVRLTGISNADVAHAPSAEEAVAALAEFVQGCPVIAHNATFDRTFIESVKGGVRVSDVWIDSLALSRIALPRLATHKLADLAEMFGCSSVSHRAMADVEALAGVWRVLLVGISDLPAGLAKLLADMHPDVPWSYRPIFSHLALETPDATFSLSAARSEIVHAAPHRERYDADELPGLSMPSAEELESAYAPGGLVNEMYEGYEPRVEQVAMAEQVRSALATSTHRAIEAGTGVGKSIAYLVPLAEAAKRNNITVGVATKSNNLTDQLMYHELPRLADAIPGGLSYCALKGYDHYPCLRKLERLACSNAEIETKRDPADTLTAIAVIYAYVCQSVNGDLDALGIRWKSVDRRALTTQSKECARRLCPFFPDKCLVHGARRRAASADIVVTNHSLLFRNVAADGKILPPIRHWVVDEAHSVEAEARKQWAVRVSADESRALFERLGGRRTGVLGQLISSLAASDSATLYMGLTAKAEVCAQRASIRMADVFDGVRELAKSARGGAYDNVNLWIGPDVRAGASWQAFQEVADDAVLLLDELCRALEAVVETVSKTEPEKVVDAAEAASRVTDLHDALKLIVDGVDDGYVYSLQVNRRMKAGGEALSAERLDIGAAFAENWLPEMHSVVFTSATLAVSGSFSHFSHAVGLDRVEKGRVKTCRLDSSYDYEENMAVVVAQDVPDPRNRDAYIDAMEDLLVSVHEAMGGSVLTLFTNRRDMEELYERVRPRLRDRGLSLDCQLRGSSPRRLRDRFLSDETLSLFALKAFWEGFDASGDALRCVVVPKLPFASPTDPLSCERDRREDRAWVKYSLPEAVLEVKQAAGRLIRSSTDSGVLVLADSRLVTKGYGRQFLNSLPTSHQRMDSANVGRYLELWRHAHDRR